jgi:hypothetical protein
MAKNAQDPARRRTARVILKTIISGRKDNAQSRKVETEGRKTDRQKNGGRKMNFFFIFLPPFFCLKFSIFLVYLGALLCPRAMAELGA